jgi:hypothetical protein
MDPSAGIGMHWARILTASIVPIVVAVPVAALAWRKGKTLLGHILGLSILLLAAITFAAMEFADAFNYRLLCQATETVCSSSDPSDFVKVAMYGVVAFIQAGVLFWLGLAVEEGARRRELDPSWRALRN